MASTARRRDDRNARHRSERLESCAGTSGTEERLRPPAAGRWFERASRDARRSLESIHANLASSISPGYEESIWPSRAVVHRTLQQSLDEVLAEVKQAEATQASVGLFLSRSPVMRRPRTKKGKPELNPRLPQPRLPNSTSPGFVRKSIASAPST